MKNVVLWSVVTFCMTFSLLAAEKTEKTGHKEVRSIGRQKISKMVESAKEADQRDVFKMLSEFRPRKGYKYSAGDEAVAHLEKLLQQGSPQTQFIAATLLDAVRAPSTKKTLARYLREKDFEELEEKVEDGEISDNAYEYQIYASMHAVQALGYVGDEDVVPLLESLTDVRHLPAARALVRLGAVEGVTTISEGAHDRKIDRAAEAVEEIRDEDEVPRLMATVRDRGVAMKVRQSALQALAAINKRDASTFIRSVIIDKKLSKRLRCSAIMQVANGSLTEHEPLLNKLAANAEPPLRSEAMIALVEMRPDKYFPRWADAVMDPGVEMKYRINLAEEVGGLPRESIKEKKKLLYKCLKAKTKRGGPADKIRVAIWKAITDTFGGRPPLILSEVTEKTKRKLRGEFDREVSQKYTGEFIHPKKLRDEIYKRIEEFVTIYKDRGKDKDTK